MIGTVGKVGLGGMITWLGGLFASLAGEQEQRQKYQSEARKREGRHTKEKHEARCKKKKQQVPLLK